jgi:peptidoglycan L-alanyl-D-glutamate endopeptidase CwlK
MRGLDKLHPEMRAKAERLQALCRDNRLPLLITETWRTEEEQDALYAKGRTAPGKIVTNCQYPYSAHCWGVAFDFCRNVKGKEYDTSDGFFEKVGKLGKSIGLFWGGDFKSFKDMPHFEHPGYVVSNSVKTLVEKWGTPIAFKKSWSEAEAVPVSLTREPPEEKPAIRKQVQVPDIAAAIAADAGADTAADAAWEWAERLGLADGIRPHEPLTGKTLFSLLRKYDAAR